MDQQKIAEAIGFTQWGVQITQDAGDDEWAEKFAAMRDVLQSLRQEVSTNKKGVLVAIGYACDGIGMTHDVADDKCEAKFQCIYEALEMGGAAVYGELGIRQMPLNALSGWSQEAADDLGVAY